MGYAGIAGLLAGIIQSSYLVSLFYSSYPALDESDAVGPLLLYQPAFVKLFIVGLTFALVLGPIHRYWNAIPDVANTFTVLSLWACFWLLARPTDVASVTIFVFICIVTVVLFDFWITLVIRQFSRHNITRCSTSWISWTRRRVVDAWHGVVDAGSAIKNFVKSILDITLGAIDYTLEALTLAAKVVKHIADKLDWLAVSLHQAFRCLRTDISAIWVRTSDLNLLPPQSSPGTIAVVEQDWTNNFLRHLLHIIKWKYSTNPQAARNQEASGQPTPRLLD